MPAYYLDTSALVKRYATEAGTAWVTTLIDPAGSHTLYTVRLTGPEMVAALGRKECTGELTPAEAMGASAAFRRVWPRRYRIVAVTVAIAERAMDLAERHGLRGYDVVHLAAALAVADVRQGGTLWRSVTAWCGTTTLSWRVARAWPRARGWRCVRTPPTLATWPRRRSW